MQNLLPKRSGIYYVKDNINNLQFKINFSVINTLLKLPKFTVPDRIYREPANLSENKETHQSEDEKIVKWQQKIFSPAEWELYSDLKNCSNDQQKKYHDEILRDKEQDRKQARKKKRKQAKSENVKQNEKGQLIYTYVHQDNFQDPNDFHNNVSSEGISFQKDQIEQMFVYAALKPDIQLAVLRWIKSENLLYIYPDFTDSKNNPYFIEIDSDYRHLYCYSIEDVSLKSLPSKEREQFLYLPEVPAHWRFEDELNKQFLMTPRNTQRCAIILSINDVKGFEYDNVHVRYHIKLPVNTFLEEGLLDGSTHSATSLSTNSPLHIGLSWQLTVLCEEQFNPSHHLRIFFELISIDSWERERLEGFSYFSMNLLKPCHHTIELNCIRPAETFLESVNRYFIGGRRKYDFANFICKQAVDDEGEVSNFYCRYGERMQNTGQLNLSYQIITQRSCELLNPCTSRTSGMTLDDIMMAYKEARRRLEAVTLS